VNDALRRAHKHANIAAAALRQAVREARAAGDSWTEIAGALGIPSLLAQQRFGTGEERDQAHELRLARKLRRRRATSRPSGATG